MTTNIDYKYKILVLIIGLMAIYLIQGCKDDDKDVSPSIEYGTLTDIDNNVYTTVKIGDQWWMAENLKVRKYKDGTFITQATSSTPYAEWDTATYGMWCAFNDNLSDSTGYLYNYYAVSNSAGIAPEGWHVATDSDWKKLESYLGINSSDIDKTGFRGNKESEKIKKAGMDYWRVYEDLWATNETGFSALAGGCRMFNGTNAGNAWSYPLDHQSSGFWWTADETENNKALFRHLDYKNGGIGRGVDSKNYGFSIRCVKD